MVNINKVMVAGNLVREPETKQGTTGTVRTTFSIAVNRTWKNSNGEKSKDTNFFKILVWGSQGEACAKYLNKGNPVLVEGRLEIKSYQNNNNEQKYMTQIIGENITFLPSGNATQSH